MENLQKTEQLYEGKAKKVYATNDENYCIVSYKDDATAFNALGLATQEEIDTIKTYTRKVNEVLKKYFLGIGIKLIDFKIEFGRLADGTIILADEISPDTCRLWDVKTNEKLDKDRFRRDLGGTEEAYQEVMKRIFGE